MAEPAPAPEDPDNGATSPKSIPPVTHSGPIPRIRNPQDSVTALTAQRRNYRDDRLSRRPPLRIRSWRAYLTTWRVIWSYLWLRLRSRFHSETWTEHKLRDVHLRNARRIERVIIELQGLFIKVGQLISIMTNFLPEEFRRELEGLQDSVPPRPFEDIEARLLEEYEGRPLSEVFAQFEPQALASASIGQVHLARLIDGTKVAVKVQYPDIEIIVRRDLNTLRRIFRIIGWFVPYQGLDELYREIRSIVMEELDYKAEANNVTRIATNFEGRTDVAFPKVVSELSTGRVLVTHFEAGCKITDKIATKQLDMDRGQLARQVVEIYCQQIFTDGVYHADPHPGNLLVRKNDSGPPTIVFLDFGAVAEIPSNVRAGIVELIQGALTRDTRRIVTAMKTMGFVARGANEQMFEQVIEYFHERFQENISLDSLNLKDIKFDPQKGLESVADLRKMDISLRELSENFHVPKEIIILERTLLLLMGLCTELDPTLNPMTVIRPYLERFVLGDEGDWSQLLVETSKDLVMSVTALPAEIRKFMRSAHSGDLSLKFKNIDAPAQLMYRLGHQVIFASVGIAGAGFALLLEGRGDVERAEWAWWTARIAGVLLVWSWWSSRNLLRKR